MVKKRNKHQLNAIQPGYQLLWYEIREILGQGGFGITYLAVDRNLAHEVAIKEYMPVDLATRTVEGSVVPLAPDREEAYRWGLERFLDEARTIGQFKHPNIVRVRNVFEANNTAYMVMDYELGETLQDILSRRKILGEEDVGTVVFPIIDGMKHVHAHGFIHRDIKPGNIFIRVDGDPVLLDFGSARQAVEQNRASLTSIFSKGYAPIEQYNNQEEQGPWTDIYAFGATMYRTIAGVPPADAIDRSSAISVAGRDTYVPAAEIGAGRYSQSLLEAIDSAMKFRRHERPQSISELQAILHGHKGTDSAPAESASVAASVPAPQVHPGPTPEPEPEPKTESPPADNRLAEMLKFAERGDAEAQCELAFMYAKGIDVPKSEARALQWYTLAAEQGHAGAQFSLGVMYAKGRSVEQNFEQAFNWYRKAAEQGHVGAKSTLATMYMKGIGTARDTKAAFDWHLRASKRGHANSMFAVGEMYFHGTGVQQNLEEAFKWYKKAAEKGHVHAQINLGFMYGKGQGVVRNDSESAQWYRKAAESGDPNAQYNLGVIYSKGRGISRDLDEARKWYALAAAQGEANAERALARLNEA